TPLHHLQLQERFRPWAIHGSPSPLRFRCNDQNSQCVMPSPLLQHPATCSRSHALHGPRNAASQESLARREFSTPPRTLPPREVRYFAATLRSRVAEESSKIHPSPPNQILVRPSRPLSLRVRLRGYSLSGGHKALKGSASGSVRLRRWILTGRDHHSECLHARLVHGADYFLSVVRNILQINDPTTMAFDLKTHNLVRS